MTEIDRINKIQATTASENVFPFGFVNPVNPVHSLFAQG
jgi:hypothetical protein